MQIKNLVLLTEWMSLICISFQPPHSNTYLSHTNFSIGNFLFRRPCRQSYMMRSHNFLVKTGKRKWITFTKLYKETHLSTGSAHALGNIFMSLALIFLEMMFRKIKNNKKKNPLMNSLIPIFSMQYILNLL